MSAPAAPRIDYTHNAYATEADVAAAIDALDDTGRLAAQMLQEAGMVPSLLMDTIERLDPNRVPVAVIEDIEAACLRTHSDLGAGSAALALWNRVRSRAGLDRLTRADLVRRTIATYRADADRAEERGDYAASDRYRGLARQVAAENESLLARDN